MGCNLQSSPLFSFSWSHWNQTGGHRGYEDMPATGESFEGKSVMILGMGNAATRIQLGRESVWRISCTDAVGTGDELSRTAIFPYFWPSIAKSWGLGNCPGVAEIHIRGTGFSLSQCRWSHWQCGSAGTSAGTAQGLARRRWRSALCISDPLRALPQWGMRKRVAEFSTVCHDTDGDFNFMTIIDDIEKRHDFLNPFWVSVLRGDEDFDGFCLRELYKYCVCECFCFICSPHSSGRWHSGRPNYHPWQHVPVEESRRLWLRCSPGRVARLPQVDSWDKGFGDLATSVNHCESSRSEVAGSWAAALYIFGRVDTWQDHRVVILPCKGNRRCIWVATDDTCNDERCRSLRRQPLHLSPSYRVRVSWRVCQTESH